MFRSLRLPVLAALLLALSPAHASVMTEVSAVNLTTNGLATTFPFTFPSLRPEWIKVQVNGAVASGTTVTLNQNQRTSPGGTVKFATAPASGSTVRIERTLPLTQETVFTAYSAFPASTVEMSLDRLTMLIQQIARYQLTGQGPPGPAGQQGAPGPIGPVGPTGAPGPVGNRVFPAKIDYLQAPPGAVQSDIIINTSNKNLYIGQLLTIPGDVLWIGQTIPFYVTLEGNILGPKGPPGEPAKLPECESGDRLVWHPEKGEWVCDEGWRGQCERAIPGGSSYQCATYTCPAPLAGKWEKMGVLATMNTAQPTIYIHAASVGNGEIIVTFCGNDKGWENQTVRLTWRLEL